MKNFWKLSLIAVVVVLVGIASQSYAASRGIRCCYPVVRTACCEPAAQCTTVMKTCQEVVYQQKKYTCYRTCYERVCEQKTLTAVRYVPETQYRECTQTVCRPVYETAEREVCYTVCKPVREIQTVKVCSGHWETRTIPASSSCDPCAPAQAERKCRVWVPQIVEKQVECVKCVNETQTKRVPYTVCRMVAEQRTIKIPYTVCRAENYQTTVPVVRYVAKQVPYTVTRCEPVVVTRQVPVTVCKATACENACEAVCCR